MIALKKQEPKILVVGDLMIDHYLWGDCKRISPEAPVQIVSVEKETSVLGGAGNVIRNLITLGSSVDVISVLGEDDKAKELKNLLGKVGVSTKYILQQKERSTSKKSRIVASNQQVLRYDQETKEDISKKMQKKLIKIFESIIKEYDLVILSDYNKGVLTPTLTQSLIKSANKQNKKILIDPKGNNFTKYKGAYLLTPNKTEAILATNIEIKDEKSLYQAIKSIKSDCNLNYSLITLSEEGIAIYDDKLRTHPTVAREVFDVTGAGDTVIASLGFAIASGYDIDEAVKFSNLCAGVVVGKIGSATVTLDEVIAYESSLHQSNSMSHIKSIDEITKLSQVLQKNNKKIVFTNGCFDILHVGHVKYLEEAKSYGDILIVGLNSDESVKRLKGDSRPINTQDDRAYLLASLEAVDFVVCFGEDTPYSLIKAIQPHILVKGGDYEGKKVVGQELADELRLVEFVDGKSTTKIIERIQNDRC